MSDFEAIAAYLAAKPVTRCPTMAAKGLARADCVHWTKGRVRAALGGDGARRVHAQRGAL